MTADDIILSYGAYADMAAFWTGYILRLRTACPFAADSVEAQAFDRGQECQARIARLGA